MAGKSRVSSILWIACIQYFAAEQVVSSAWTLPYSYAKNFVSDLGAVACSASVCSPWHGLMNASFVLQGLLIAAGALLSWKPWGAAGRIGLALLVGCGGGVVVVGFVPEDAGSGLHRTGAALHFLAGGLGMITVGAASDHWFRRLSIGTGAVVVCATIELGWRVGGGVELIGAGGLERVAAYGIAGWMVALGMLSYPRGGN